MEKTRETLGTVKSDTTKVFCVDGGRKIVRHDGTTSAGSHNRDQYVAWMNCVAGKLEVLCFTDKPTLPPAKLVLYSVIDAKDSNAVIGELAIQELAAEWARSNRSIGV